ncbi:MAG: hypothetical protein KME42_13265 [Tildeniella nuda ZEHNDER 1965/U140]|nr:hypothetical protein [Tildeniella nuda ZEHNDER 1965/U140]
MARSGEEASAQSTQAQSLYRGYLKRSLCALSSTVIWSGKTQCRNDQHLQKISDRLVQRQRRLQH